MPPEAAARWGVPVALVPLALAPLVLAPLALALSVGPWSAPALAAPPAARPAGISAGISAAPAGPAAVTLRRDVDVPRVLAPQARLRRELPVLSTWQVRFSGSLADPATTAAAQASVRAAVATWSREVASAVPVTLDVSFRPTAAGVLASTSPAMYFHGGGLGDGTTYYPAALAEALLGQDLSARDAGRPAADIRMTMSSSEPRTYYGDDGRPPAGWVDAQTVALHEIAHGLGFGGTLAVTDGRGTLWDPPTVYDTFPATPEGRVVRAAGSTELARAATGGRLVWTGPQARAASGAADVRLYAPSAWEPGSSYSHLDESTYPAGSPDALLTPYLSADEVVAAPGPVTLGVLRDLGWTTSVPPSDGSSIDARYTGEPALRALLGEPIGPEQVDGDVRWRVYEGGRLYFSTATGVHAVHGDVLTRFLDGGGHPVLGVPGTDELAGDGGSRYNDFTRGVSIYWTPSAGAYLVHGDIRVAWLTAGREAGPLGSPLGEERDPGDGTGRYVDFSRGGSVYWSPATGAHVVYGALRQRWLAEGGAPGPYGYPVTDETGTATGARYNDFSRGWSLYWSPATGAHSVHGAVRTVWSAHGGADRLGVPVTDELAAPDAVGRYNDFAAGCTVAWSPRTGAHEVHGAIRTAWLATGGLGGVLGSPVTSEEPAPGGAGRVNDFSAGGSVYWSPRTGAQPVYGAIRQRWLALGGVSGRLGYPVTGEYAVPGGRRSDFTGGSVLWTPSGGAVELPR